MYKLISGEICDFSQLDSYGNANVIIIGGPHHGHNALVTGAKFNCGAGWEHIICSCGAEFESQTSGCWQMGHNWPSYTRGDKYLDFAIRDGEYLEEIEEYHEREDITDEELSRFLAEQADELENELAQMGIKRHPRKR